MWLKCNSCTVICCYLWCPPDDVSPFIRHTTFNKLTKMSTQVMSGCSWPTCLWTVGGHPHTQEGNMLLDFFSGCVTWEAAHVSECGVTLLVCCFITYCTIVASQWVLLHWSHCFVSRLLPGVLQTRCLISVNIRWRESSVLNSGSLNKVWLSVEVIYMVIH